MTAQKIVDAIQERTPHRTLQYRLSHLVRQKRLVRKGDRRWAKYRLPSAPEAAPPAAGGEPIIPLSAASREIQAYLRRPVETRKPVGCDRAFLDSYRPNASAYLSAAERTHRREIGKPTAGDQPAGRRQRPRPIRSNRRFS